jgi:hypothetical protein
MAEQTIAAIPKTSREEIGVSLSEFNGQLANLRIWLKAKNGTKRPVNKGLAFKLEKLKAVIAAVQELEAEARRRNLIK